MTVEPAQAVMLAVACAAFLGLTIAYFKGLAAFGNPALGVGVFLLTLLLFVGFWPLGVFTVILVSAKAPKPKKAVTA